MADSDGAPPALSSRLQRAAASLDAAIAQLSLPTGSSLVNCDTTERAHVARKLDKCAQDAFDAVRKHSQVSDQTHPILESRALTNTQAELHTVLQERGLPALFERYATEEQSDELAPGECEEMWEAREKAKREFLRQLQVRLAQERAQLDELRAQAGAHEQSRAEFVAKVGHVVAQLRVDVATPERNRVNEWTDK